MKNVYWMSVAVIVMSNGQMHAMKALQEKQKLIAAEPHRKEEPFVQDTKPETADDLLYDKDELLRQYQREQLEKEAKKTDEDRAREKQEKEQQRLKEEQERLARMQKEEEERAERIQKAEQERLARQAERARIEKEAQEKEKENRENYQKCYALENLVIKEYIPDLANKYFDLCKQAYLNGGNAENALKAYSDRKAAIIKDIQDKSDAIEKGFFKKKDYLVNNDFAQYVQEKINDEIKEKYFKDSDALILKDAIKTIVDTLEKSRGQTQVKYAQDYALALTNKLEERLRIGQNTRYGTDTTLESEYKKIPLLKAFIKGITKSVEEKNNALKEIDTQYQGLKKNITAQVEQIAKDAFEVLQEAYLKYRFGPYAARYPQESTLKATLTKDIVKTKSQIEQQNASFMLLWKKGSEGNGYDALIKTNYSGNSDLGDPITTLIQSKTRLLYRNEMLKLFAAFKKSQSGRTVEDEVRELESPGYLGDVASALRSIFPYIIAGIIMQITKLEGEQKSLVNMHSLTLDKVKKYIDEMMAALRKEYANYAQKAYGTSYENNPAYLRAKQKAEEIMFGGGTKGGSSSGSGAGSGAKPQQGSGTKGGSSSPSPLDPPSQEIRTALFGTHADAISPDYLIQNWQSIQKNYKQAALSFKQDEPKLQNINGYYDKLERAKESAQIAGIQETVNGILAKNDSQMYTLFNLQQNMNDDQLRQVQANINSRFQDLSRYLAGYESNLNYSKAIAKITAFKDFIDARITKERDNRSDFFIRKINELIGKYNDTKAIMLMIMEKWTQKEKDAFAKGEQDTFNKAIQNWHPEEREKLNTAIEKQEALKFEIDLLRDYISKTYPSKVSEITPMNT